MASAQAKFKQIDVTRVLKGARAAGCDDVRIEIAADGGLTVITGKAAALPTSKNSFDELLR
jgi:hypothetical protein